jgi:hypothetical protein
VKLASPATSLPAMGLPDITPEQCVSPFKVI